VFVAKFRFTGATQVAFPHPVLTVVFECALSHTCLSLRKEIGSRGRASIRAAEHRNVKIQARQIHARRAAAVFADRRFSGTNRFRPERSSLTLVFAEIA
jgi:hypothetical protein